MLHDIKSILHLIVIFQCLFFSFYLLTLKNIKRLSNIILAAFLLSKAISEIGGVFAHFAELREFVISHCPHLLYIHIPFHYLYVPVLFLYVLSLTKKQFHIRKNYLVHFFPFIIFCILIILKFYMHGADRIRDILNGGNSFSSLEGWLFGILVYVQFFSYTVASLIIIKKYQAEIKNVYSTIEHINLSWLNFVLFGFIGWKSLEVIEFILLIISKPHSAIFFYITSEVVFLIFVSLMFFKGLKQPEIFSGNNENHNKRKYEKVLLSEAIKEDYKNKLIQCMEAQKPYLEPLLRLDDLAEKASIPPQYLSQVLNTCLNKNFFDFINSYRIKESKNLLSGQASNNKTILEILYESGFNSKSVFNTAFKKHTGMTPSQFRRLQNS
jgi:AraC-like DNA-binding protein